MDSRLGSVAVTLGLAALGLVPLGLGGSLARAQEAPPRRITQRIDLELEGASLDEAVAQIAKRSGARLLADPEVKAQISLRLRSVQWKQALRLVAERAGCEVQRRGRFLLVTRPKDRINIELYDANVRTALLLLARYADQSIVISPEVQGTITLRLQNVSAARAIRAVAETAGDYVVVGERGGPWRASPRAGVRAGEAPTPEKEREGPQEAVDRVVEGTFRGLQEPRRGTPKLLLERREEGATVLEKLPLARDPVVRALQVRLLRSLQKGARLVIGLEKTKAGWRATHLVSSTGARPKQDGRAE